MNILKEDHILSKIIDTVLTIMIGTITFLGFGQVLLRYLLKWPMLWAEEALVFLFVWSTLIGGAVCIRRKSLIKIDDIINKFPFKLQMLINIINNIMVLVFLCFLFFYGVKFLILTNDKLSLVLRIPMSIPYASVPAFTIVSIIYQVALIIEQFKLYKSGCKESNFENI